MRAVEVHEVHRLYQARQEWGSDSDSEWDVLDGSENAFLSEFWAARGGGVGI